MSTPENNLFETLDIPDSEPSFLDATPEDATPPDATPTEVTPERERDPTTGRFVPQPPASMPDPVKVAEQAAAEPAPAEPQKVIPLGAHLAERDRWQSQVAELRERLAKLEPPPAPPKPEPDFIEDPKAYIDAKVERAQEALKQIEQKVAPVEQEAQINRLLSHVGAIEGEFVKQTPDYYEAVGHVRQARAEQLTMLYPDAPREQIFEALRREELTFAAQALQAGRNPSELAYQMAQRVFGYRPKAADAPPPPPRPKTGDPSATLGASGSAPDAGDIDEVGREDGDELRSTLDLAIKERFNRR